MRSFTRVTLQQNAVAHIRVTVWTGVQDVQHMRHTRPCETGNTGRHGAENAARRKNPRTTPSIGRSK